MTNITAPVPRGAGVIFMAVNNKTSNINNNLTNIKVILKSHNYIYYVYVLFRARIPARIHTYTY